MHFVLETSSIQTMTKFILIVMFCCFFTFNVDANIEKPMKIKREIYWCELYITEFL